MIGPGETSMQDLQASVEKLAADGIKFIQIETPDINGTLRGKLTRVDKVLSASGSSFCTILYGLTYFDEVCEGRFSSFANGFPDALAVADIASLRVLDRANGVAAVICDMRDFDSGEHHALSPRGALHRAVERAGRSGYQARFAVELELCVIRADEALIGSGRHYEQRAFGRTHNAYSLVRLGELRDIAADFLAKMDALDIPVEAIHSELGHGMLEIALGHLPALEAADACARIKLYLKDHLARHGLTGVFMPKWRIAESGCGGHVHQSLWKDGAPAFAAPNGGLSDVALQYVAGQLATMGDLAAIFYPSINSYRRMDAETWAPENVSWGKDNRTCALRAILRPGPKAYRIEHRCPGADVNPYLAIAAMLAGGMHGIENTLQAPEPVTGNAGADASLARLPRSLAAATDLLESSTLAQSLIGKDIVEQYVITRRKECQLWEDWQRQQVSAWEIARYFDTH